jgi:hypothetical protein
MFGVFLLKLLLLFAKNFIVTLVFEKNANFFAEIWQASPKIVVITSTPGGRILLHFFPQRVFSGNCAVNFRGE